MKKKKNHKKTKTRGKCLCCGSSAEGKAISSTSSHGHFPQSSPAPFQRAPPPHRVSGSPLQWPHPQTQSLAHLMPHSPGKPAEAPWARPILATYMTPPQATLTTHTAHISLSFSQPLLGPRSWHTWGPASITPWLPQLGKYLTSRYRYRVLAL